MRILAVAATALEVPRLRGGACGRHHVDLLVTGVGMVATAARVSRALALERYDAAFCFGVCGSFDPALPPGTVVHVTQDDLPELGAEDGDAFITLKELGLTDGTCIVNANPPACAVLGSLPAVRGITVNTVHGNDRTISEIVARVHPQVESMEGAAFAYGCAIAGVPYAQVRAVSNVVERRNRAAWRMDVAIRNLNDTALRILESL